MRLSAARMSAVTRAARTPARAGNGAPRLVRLALGLMLGALFLLPAPQAAAQNFLFEYDLGVKSFTVKLTATSRLFAFQLNYWPSGGGRTETKGPDDCVPRVKFYGPENNILECTFAFDPGDWTIRPRINQLGARDPWTYLHHPIEGRPENSLEIYIPAIDAPTGLTATADGDKQITLNWTAPTPPSGQSITGYAYRKKIAGDTSWDPWVNIGTATRRTVTGLSSRNYNFQVRARTGQGYGISSPTATAEAVAKLIFENNKPSVTTQPSGDGVTEELTLDWDFRFHYTHEAPTKQEWRTKVSHEVGDALPWSQWRDVAPTARSVSVSGASLGVGRHGSLIDFEVRATNPGGVTVGTKEYILAPKKTTNLTATSGEVRQVSLSWVGVDGHFVGYQYRQRKGQSAPWGNWNGVPGMDTRHTVTGLLDGEEYSFQVRAVGTDKGGTESFPAVATTLAKPARLTVTARRGDGEVELSWPVPAVPVTRYQYRQSSDGGTNWGGWTNTSDTAARHTVTGLTNGTEYSFQVQAENAAGQSPVSATVTATPSSTLLEPRELEAVPGDRQVTLLWTAPFGSPTKYQYRQSLDGGTSWTGWTDASGTDTRHVVTGLTADTEYSFQVRAVGISGPGPVSAIVTATTGSRPAAPRLSAEQVLSLDNPFSTTRVVELTWAYSGGPVTVWEFRVKPRSHFESEHGTWIQQMVSVVRLFQFWLRFRRRTSSSAPGFRWQVVPGIPESCVFC